MDERAAVYAGRHHHHALQMDERAAGQQSILCVHTYVRHIDYQYIDAYVRTQAYHTIYLLLEIARYNTQPTPVGSAIARVGTRYTTLSIHTVLSTVSTTKGSTVAV
jgi:hypothetical protein